MPIKLMYRTPDMSKGKDVGGPMASAQEVREFLQGADAMPDNTLFYYSEGPMGMAGKAFIVRNGRAIEVWSSKLYRRDKITMAQAMAAAPKLSDSDLEELLG